jgi:3-hydroxyacyl-[acyl-carrier-protein] dehydratase
MLHSVEQTFPLDHPTASGHFPGNPIIPGAVLLDTVLAVLEAHEAPLVGGYSLGSAKFLQPVRPGDRVEIRWKSPTEHQVRFECLLEGRAVLSGSLNLRTP